MCQEFVSAYRPRMAQLRNYKKKRPQASLGLNSLEIGHQLSTALVQPSVVRLAVMR
jgi:hypothetical protein